MPYQLRPSVASDAAGNFVVAWERFSYGFPGFDFYDVVARRFTSAGSPIGGDFQVSSYPVYYFLYPRTAVAANGDGDFVVVWEGITQDTIAPAVLARRFSSNGAALNTELKINSLPLNADIFAPAIASTVSGDFIVAWANDQDGDGSGVFARRFSRDGTALANELQVNSFTADDQTFPVIGLEPDGDFLMAWSSRSAGASRWDVFAQRFTIPTPTPTATFTPTATSTVTPTSTAASTPSTSHLHLYEVPTLSRTAMVILSALLLAGCLAVLARDRAP
jgi:hypothetical protein